MQNLNFIIGGAVLAIYLTVSGCSPVKREPFTCNVHLNSASGGVIDVTRIDPNPKLPFPDKPLHIFWHAPADGAGMDLIVNYPAATLMDVGVSNGGRLQFSPGIGSSAAEFQAVFSTGDDKAWRFGADPDFSSEQGDFIISTNNPSGKAITEAINSGKRIKVVILKNDKVLTSETFDTSPTVERNKLLDQARPLVETLDSRFLPS